MTDRVKYVCSRCGVPCGEWYYGWKHHAGGGSKPTCGQKPDPVEVPPENVEEPT